jgi:hypothetical protein
MNRPPDIELVLRSYLEDTGDRAPDRVLADVAARIAHQPRRAWRLRGRPFVNTYAKLAAGLAAAVVVVIVGWSLLPTNPGVGEPSPTPSAASSQSVGPSPSPLACENDLAGCAGPLAAGTTRTVHFNPAFQYTVPTGWVNGIDIDDVFTLTRPDWNAEIAVFSGVVPAEATTECTIVAKPGAGTTVDAWITFMTTHPGIVASQAQEVSMNGTTVQAFDLRSNPDWEPPCPSNLYPGRIPLIKLSAGSAGTESSDGLGLNDALRLRAYVIGAGNETVIVTLYSYEASAEALVSAVELAEPVISTFLWACNPESPPGPCWGSPDASGNPATPPS